MARLMSDEALKRRVRRRVEEAVNGGWYFQAGYFRKTAQITSNGIFVDIELRWKFGGLEAEVDQYNVYGGKQAKVFGSGDALEELVVWTTETIVGLSLSVEERTAPYKNAKELYDRALRGGNV